MLESDGACRTEMTNAVMTEIASALVMKTLDYDTMRVDYCRKQFKECSFNGCEAALKLI